jgi:hypothetical protein
VPETKAWRNMKIFKSLPLLTLLSFLSSLPFGATSFAQVNAVRCSDSSSDLSPDSFFYISSDEVGSIVTIGDENYKVVSSQAGMHDDIWMLLVALQSLQNPEATSLGIVCF